MHLQASEREFSSFALTVTVVANSEIRLAVQVDVAHVKDIQNRAIDSAVLWVVLKLPACELVCSRPCFRISPQPFDKVSGYAGSE